ncbi:MAG: DUF424 domain-containing protein [Candidatus Hydrothermarchaeaceae archaeon]
MGFHFKIYREEGEVLVAACDEDICGLTFEEDKLVLDVRRDFYGSELADWKRLRSFLAEATILNLVGEELISRAVEAGFIDAENVMRVKGVPHAKMVRI